MDIADGLYGFYGTSDPATLLMDVLVAAVLAVSFAYLALELYRVYGEYARKEAPPREGAVKPPMPGPLETMKAPVAGKAAIPDVDVIGGSLQDSMAIIARKYGLSSITLASQDGLSIASTNKAPDQDAAVFSGLYQELFKVKQEPCYRVEDRAVSLFAVEGGAQKVIGIAGRAAGLSPDEARAIREDAKRALDHFAAGGNKSKSS